MREKIGLICLFFASYASCYEGGYGAVHDQAMSLQAQIDQIVAKNDMRTKGAINASGCPNLVNPTNLEFFIDPLFLHSKVQGTSFAYKASSPSDQYPIRAQNQQVKLGWDWGIRLGAGYHIDGYEWDVDLSYTWIKSDASQKVNNPLNGSIMPLKGVVYLGQSVDWASSKLDVEQSSLLARLSKSYYVSQRLSLTPYGALKNSWIDINQWTQYYGGGAGAGNLVHVRDRSKFWGIGPAIGNMARFYLGRGVALVGDLQIAMQYGLFKVGYDERQSDNINQSMVIDESMHQFVPNFEIDLGATWGTFFNDDHCYASFGIAYQVQYWMNQNQSINVIQNYGSRYFNLSDDVSFHGLMLQAKLDF